MIRLCVHFSKMTAVTKQLPLFTAIKPRNKDNFMVSLSKSTVVLFNDIEKSLIWYREGFMNTNT